MSKLHRNRERNAGHAHSLLDALEYHREIKRQCIEWTKKHYSGLKLGPSYKYGRKRKKPWYMITTGKQYNYEQRTEVYGMVVNYYRVLSQAGKAAKKTTIKKMSRIDYNYRLVEAKLKDWVEKHPNPVPYNPQQKDLFEKEYLLPWVEEHTKARENIIKFVNNIGNKVIIYGRYIDDTGYPRKIAEFRSDHQKLMIFDGKYANHIGSKTIQKAQRIANNFGKLNAKFIALKVVDGNQECILIPNRNSRKVA